MSSNFARCPIEQLANVLGEPFLVASVQVMIAFGGAPLRAALFEIQRSGNGIITRNSRNLRGAPGLMVSGGISVRRLAIRRAAVFR